MKITMKVQSEKNNRKFEFYPMNIDFTIITQMLESQLNQIQEDITGKLQLKSSITITLNKANLMPGLENPVNVEKKYQLAAEKKFSTLQESIQQNQTITVLLKAANTSIKYGSEYEEKSLAEEDRSKQELFTEEDNKEQELHIEEDNRDKEWLTEDKEQTLPMNICFPI